MTTTWTYDRDYRLLGQQAPSANATFAYDPAGNILLKWQDGTPPMTMTFDGADRLLTILQGANLTTVTFDANGNQTGENLNGALTTNTYEQENRLVGVALSDSTCSTYAFAGDGLRRSLQEPGKSLTTIVWDGTDYLMEKS